MRKPLSEPSGSDVEGGEEEAKSGRQPIEGGPQLDFDPW